MKVAAWVLSVVAFGGLCDAAQLLHLSQQQGTSASETATLNATSWYWLGLKGGLREGTFFTAEECFQKALELRPKLVKHTFAFDEQGITHAAATWAPEQRKSLLDAVIENGFSGLEVLIESTWMRNRFADEDGFADTAEAMYSNLSQRPGRAFEKSVFKLLSAGQFRQLARLAAPADRLNQKLMANARKVLSMIRTKREELKDERFDLDPKNPKFVSGRFGSIQPWVQDHSVREPATNTPFGHTTEIKALLLDLARSVGMRNIALSGMFYGDMYTVEEQQLELMALAGTSFDGCFVMCAPAKDTRAAAMRVLRTFAVPNVFLDVTTETNVRFSISLSSIEGMVLDAVHEADGIFHGNFYPPPRNRSDRVPGKAPRGEVYVNLVDLMETLNLTSDGTFQNVDAQGKLEGIFSTWRADWVFQKRVTAILFEEGRGRAISDDYGTVAKWLRDSFPEDQYLILVHAHGGTGLENQAPLRAVEEGANGMWAGFIPQAAQVGHSSSFLFLDHLVYRSNPDVLNTYQLGQAIEVAKQMYKLNFNTNRIPKDCPIWGTAAFKLKHTAFSQNEGWRSRTEKEYACWAKDDTDKIDKLSSDACIIENKNVFLRLVHPSSFETEQSSEFEGWEIAPLVSDTELIGKRVQELGLIDDDQQVVKEVGEKLRELFMALQVAGFRMDYNSRDVLEVLVRVVRGVEDSQKTAQVRERHLGGSHIDVARTLVLGQPEEKNDLLERALEIQEHLYGRSDINAARTLSDIGNAYGALGQPEQQKVMLERALKIQEQLFGKDHVEVVPTLASLGSAYNAWALQIQKQHFGENHVQVARTLTDLGNAHSALGQPEQQKEVPERAPKIQEKHFGEDHVDVARTFAALANAYGDFGQYEQQMEMLERALPIFEAHFGKDHVEVARTLEKLGRAYGAFGQPEQQKEMLERAFQIKEQHFGGDHVEVARTLADLGDAYDALGQREQQKEVLESALPALEAHFGKDHVALATTLVNLGSAYGALGQREQQRGLQERALKVQEQHYGKDHVQVAHTLADLGNAYGALGQPEQQKKMQERALKIQEQHFGSDHAEEVRTLAGLGSAFGALGQYEQQKEMLERALEIQEQHFGKDHVEVATTLVSLGSAYGALGQPEKQKEMLERALQIKEQHFGRERALQINERHFGKDHVEVART
eukprot:CAMPEP_0198491998 /NCGR_PEP_ID=MMETSP1462-20131121/3160_1 /TAXON_ID=1333877 /ORGANISM="Brandtodinium nutriculum, Strain RCC3387" /LENGTH=1167 /DNA_ID=CAMNT_0044220631 /DNA_START=77 /DNA_END=3575 /DNA_ORIENTATION=-